MSLWRDDQNEDIQLVMKKGEQVLNVSVKMVFFILSLPECILNDPQPPFFFCGQVIEIGHNLQNAEVFLQFLLFFFFN